MGFGHRVYRAYDPRAAALRGSRKAWPHGRLAQPRGAGRDVVLRVLAELKPGRTIKTNVEYYAAAVLQGVGLPPELFPATFALARHAGWTARDEQSAANRLIRPDMRYTSRGATSPRRSACGELWAACSRRPDPWARAARRPPAAASPRSRVAISRRPRSSSDAFRALISDDEADQTDGPRSTSCRVLALRLRRGRLSVVDATNATPGDRSTLLRLAAAARRPAVAIVLDLPVDWRW
jgi:hypothetical protein